MELIISRIKAKIRHWIRRKPQIHILSDSHGEAFKFIDWTKFNKTPSYCIIQGATASGLANPNSKTKALPIFQNYLKKRVKKFDRIVFQLGEIDCGFTIWLRAEMKLISIDKQLKLTIDNYRKLLEYAQSIISKPIIVTSAILPTIEDGQDFGEIANLRKEVQASQYQRTQLTLKFNKAIKVICESNNFQYIDLDKELLNPTTSIVKEEYKNKSKLDHHLNPHKLAQLLEGKLSDIIK